MKKIAFMIPGLGHSGKEKEYKRTAEFFRKQNFEVVIVDIDWKRRTHSQYVEQAKLQISEFINKGNEIHFFGFSFGAMIALELSSGLKLKNLILCSLSPFFMEDMSKIKQWWKKYHGKRRCAEFEKLSFSKLAKNISAKTFILAGNKEGIEVERRAKDANSKIAKSELIFIEGVKHDISDKKYLSEIEKVINSLN